MASEAPHAPLGLTPAANAATTTTDAPAHDVAPAVPSEKDDVLEADEAEESQFEPIRSTTSRMQRNLTGDDLFKALSQRRTNASSQGEGVEDDHGGVERADIERLMSRMFGAGRQANSDEEKSRHVGVIFRHLTVKGMGLGAALQPENADIFLGLPRLIARLVGGAGNKVSSRPPIRTLLNDFNGCVKPGEMCLVLGRPGSGCSTFLKVIGNQRFGFQDVTGDVSYGGTDAATMAKSFRGDVLYNPEDDLHYATLTVRNTLEFALKTRTPGKDSRAEGESRSQYTEEFLRVVAKLFWIEHTLGTKVGNEMIRGVSGGEKKRVSIAEAMITKASTQCWDNSTRGLDASTALEYVEALRTLTNMAHISTFVALYQAGESLYNLFDKVLLIEGGRCCYFGPTDDAKAYFEHLGFVCPARWTTADFLTSVTDAHERNVREGYEHRIPRNAEQFEKAYQNSDMAKRALTDIQALEAAHDEQRQRREAAHAAPAKPKNYTIPFYKQVLACTYRQFLVTKGDKLSLWGKWGGILFQALIVGSLFYSLPHTALGVFPKGGVLFFALLFNALLALAELTAAFSSRPIVLKHKSFSFYRPAAYAVGQVVLDLPLVAVQVFIFDVVVYWMADLGHTASQFFISLLILWVLTLSMYSYFRALGALCGSLDVASRLTGLSIQILITYTGYLIPPGKQHPWLHWLSYVNPVQYGFEALMANEFTGAVIECVPPYLVPTGPNVTAQHQSCLIQGSVAGQPNVDGAAYIETGFGYTRAHLWRNIGIVIAFWLFFVALTMFGMEVQKPNKGGGSVTIFKRGQVPKSVQKLLDNKAESPRDEESGEKPAGLDQADTSGSDSDREEVKGVAKNETVFTWTNVNYRIPFKRGELQLLRDVQGYVRPGKLTALMGASGAGKTTLLNTLAQRVTFGVVQGDFLVDGRPLPKSFQRATGFAEQQDIHESTATIREALRFSALLRQPKEVPRAEKYEYVEKIISILEMEDIAGATIGKIGSGLNQEQRKRVTIGVELASKPELLMFLDEPTSGLDSGAAFNIVRFLRKLADAGQAILCTIHQPSSVLFEYFDELILLKNGGRVVYHGALGKDSREMITYFERHGSKKCPPRANPAEFMLEAIGAGNPDYQGQDWGDVWAASEEHRQRTQEIQQMIVDRSHATAGASTRDDREYAMPLSTQVVAVVKRSFVAYWRSPEYIIGKFSLHIFTGLFNTFTYWKLGHSTIDMQSRLFSVFSTLTISPPLIQQLQPRFLAFRNIYESRESKAKIYSWAAMVTGAVAVELPYSIVAGTIYFNCWYWGVGFPQDSFTAGYTWMLVMLFEIFYVGFGQGVASFAANDLLASLLVPVFFLFIVSFCGVVVPFQALPYFWRSWMYYLTPFRYLLSGFLGVLLHNLPVECADTEFARFSPPAGQTCEQYTSAFVKMVGGYVQERDGLCNFCQYANGDQYLANLNIYYSDRWLDYGVFAAFCVFNFMVVFFCSWLFLRGGARIRAALRPRARKQAKAAN
ncbi:MAG: hypothetical protein M1838_000677 [Thelocarpon superellum]|nr:MAG: hypothetical protein M1838_000677 [Thelocarpon superellum]